MQVPSLRLVIWGFVCSIALLGHPHREPGDAMKWETNSSHALTTKSFYVNQQNDPAYNSCWWFFLAGRGVPSNILKLLA